jgi:hypothetical protein
MGRQRGRIQNRPFHMRVSEAFLRAVDRWRSGQEGPPSRSESIRSLVKIGIAHSQPVERYSSRAAAKASEMAADQIDKLSDASLPDEERHVRKRRLIK